MRMDMIVLLVVPQGLFTFAFAEATKVLQSIPKLTQQFPWVERFPAWVVRSIGTTEAIGGLGVIPPWKTGVAPALTPLAAFGLAVIMVLALVHHLRNGKGKLTVINITLLLIALAIGLARLTEL